MHMGDECQAFWRARFAEQLEGVVNTKWPEETDTETDRAKWFREGVRYAMMIVRWDSDDEASD